MVLKGIQHKLLYLDHFFMLYLIIIIKFQINIVF